MRPEREMPPCYSPGGDGLLLGENPSPGAPGFA